MKTIRDIYFFLMLGLLAGILTFWMRNWIFGGVLFIIGLLGISLYFLIDVLRDTLLKKNNYITTITRISIILMCITIFTKYFHLNFFDYPTLLIVPIFLIASTVYLVFEKLRNPKIFASIIIFTLLLIPMFGVSFYNSPFSYLPGQHQSKFNVSKGVEISLPYKFKNNNVILLRNRANRLKLNKDFNSAIIVYKQALIIDKKNPRLYFELSDCYARIDDLERAISLMDSAIILDSSSSAFYNNRGLLYYKMNDYYTALNDYSTAIYLDSSNKVAYGNTALVYDALGNSLKACEYIEKAEKIGLDITLDEQLARLKRNKCK